jgi:hypothetical protein
MIKPELSEHPPYYTYYINLVQFNDGVEALQNQLFETQQFIDSLPIELGDFRYAEGKWSIKEVLGHICDTERILAYRALCFARGEQIELPGFNENHYVTSAQFNDRSLYDIAHELSAVRTSNIALFKSFDVNMLDKVGTANKNKMSVRAIIYMIAGHEKHHIHIIKARYLKTTDSF